MAEMKVEIVLPRNLLDALNVQESELGGLAKEWVVLALFLEGRISAGKAAEVLGIPKAQFIDLLNQRNLPYLDADSKELEREIAAAEAVAPTSTTRLPEQHDNISGETRSVRIVKKGKLCVAEPVDPGEPLTAGMVREVQDWIRDRGIDLMATPREELDRVLAGGPDLESDPRDRWSPEDES